MEDAAVFYECNTDHTSSGGNRPPGAFWDVIVPTNPNVDVTDQVETVLETEVGTGEVRSMQLRFNAEFGQYLQPVY